jgi:hypothetical protein
VVLALAACGGGSPAPARGGIAYLIGYSTDPYGGGSIPRRFGVATGITSGRLHRVEVKARRPHSITWIGSGRLVVATTFALDERPVDVFAFRGDRLERLGAAPLRAGDLTSAWSPHQKLIASEPWVQHRCGRGTCIHSGRSVFVERADGSGRHRVARGLLRSWTPDGRLLFFTGPNFDVAGGAFRALDLRSGRRRTVLSSRWVSEFAHRHAELGALAYSADGRYLAARVALGNSGCGEWSSPVPAVRSSA